MVNRGAELDGVAIVLATSEDWEQVRDLRIRALADAPFAYGSRLEEEQDRPESFWRARLESEAAWAMVSQLPSGPYSVVSRRSGADRRRGCCSDV